MTKKELRALGGIRSMLSRHNSNPKVAKAEAILGVSTSVLHLAPSTLSGFDVCKKATPGCKVACLHYAGAPQHFRGKTAARVARTKFLLTNRSAAMELLRLEIVSQCERAVKKGFVPSVRLNGTSDLAWERLRGTYGTLFQEYPEVVFYDYTAVIERLRRPLPENYILTFSLKEDNLAQAYEAIERGFNVAAVFLDELPSTFLGLPVHDGDTHDFRPADPRGVIVGLRAKGERAKADTTGFVINQQFLGKMAA